MKGEWGEDEKKAWWTQGTRERIIKRDKKGRNLRILFHDSLFDAPPYFLTPLLTESSQPPGCCFLLLLYSQKPRYHLQSLRLQIIRTARHFQERIIESAYSELRLIESARMMITARRFRKCFSLLLYSWTTMEGEGETSPLLDSRNVRGKSGNNRVGGEDSNNDIVRN